MFSKLKFIIAFIMFGLPVFLLVAVSLAQASPVDNQQVRPYALVDEVKAQLAGLREVVEGNIHGAFDALNHLISLLQYFQDNTVNKAVVDIQQDHDDFVALLETLKDLAAEANVNIDKCLGQQGLLNELPAKYIPSLYTCTSVIRLEVLAIQTDARYYIDTMVTDVSRMESQVNACREDFLCLAPLANEIELSLISIPQNIGKEVDKAGVLLDNLKVIIQGCTDNNVSGHSARGSDIMNDMTTCVNGEM